MIHYSHPVDDPDGIVLRLWTDRRSCPTADRAHLDATEAELDDIDEAVRWARARLAAGRPAETDRRDP